MATGPDDKRHRKHESLRERPIDLRFCRFVERSKTDVPGDADNLRGFLTTATYSHQLPPDRCGRSTKLATRQGLVDNRDSRRLVVILRAEQPACAEGNAHRLEII